MKIEIPAKHLGDIIGIIQNHLDAEQFYAHSTCICCGNDCLDCTRQILELLNIENKLTKNSKNAIKGEVIWFNKKWDYSSYSKIKIKSKKENYYCYQFDARSSYHKLPSKEQLDNFLKNFPGDLIDVGEKSKLNVKEKFNIINNSISYIGVDSGVTHLAMMSNTPTFVFQNEKHPRQFSYPKTTQIKFCIDYRDIIDKVKKMRLKI